jgi:hypothetical protein
MYHLEMLGKFFRDTPFQQNMGAFGERGCLGRGCVWGEERGCLGRGGVRERAQHKQLPVHVDSIFVLQNRNTKK